MKPIRDVRNLSTKPVENPSPLIVGNEDVGVVIVLKAASRSMLAAQKPVDSSNELHIFVREPIERLRSAFQFFKGMQKRRTDPDSFFGIMPQRLPTLTTWEHFVDMVLAGEKNPHWKPVAEIIRALDRPVQAHLFENLDTEFPLGPLGRRNVSKKQSDVDMTYRADELREMYADDYAIRSEL